nr:putative capsid protein [Crucivirus sp.]
MLRYIYKMQTSRVPRRRAVARPGGRALAVAPVAPRRRRAPAPRGAVSGKGFYKGFGQHLGTAIGGAVSALVGVPGLDKVGGRLGAMGAKATGFGAYAISKNSLVMQDPPEIHNARAKEGAMVVCHREYLTDIQGSTGFTIQGMYDLQPGLDAGFPWLSQIANAFEEWEPMGILVEFVTTSGNAISSTNPALGEVILSTQYNSYAPAFTTKQQMLNQIFAVSSVPSQNVIHPIECKPSQNQVTRFYTRNSAPIGDTRLYDLGRLSVATSGQQAVSAIGELWITYQIAFYKPKLLSPSALLSLPLAEYSFVYGGTTDPIFGQTGSAPILQSAGDPFGLQFAPNRLAFTCPGSQGTTFEVTMVLNGVGANDFSSQPLASLSNCTASNTATDSTGAVSRSLICAKVTSTLNMPVSCIQSYVVTVTDPTLPWSMVWLPTGTAGSNYANLPPSPGGQLYVSKLS